MQELIRRDLEDLTTMTLDDNDDARVDDSYDARRRLWCLCRSATTMTLDEGDGFGSNYDSQLLLQ
eukprot:1642545-Rhodomonas_salina.2